MENSEIPDTWPRFPEAELFFRTLLNDFTTHNPPIATLRGKLAAVGVDIATLVDHWILPENSVDPKTLESFGLEQTTRKAGDRVWETRAARLPGVRFKNRPAPTLALRVESIDQFSRANDLPLETIHGTPDSPYRCGHRKLPVGELMPIERRGTREYTPGTLSPEHADACLRFLDILSTRNRHQPETDTVAELDRWFGDVATLVGNGPAVNAFFESERRYYESRNSAARWQKARQDLVGIGWANHDHHTYRCTREIFQPLLQLFVNMGFVCRERFHAGTDAGWGAQILEHPDSDVVLFVDVDLGAGEENVDFLQQPLAPRNAKGTIGLWCALHGSSIGAAGLHHLECEFLHDIVRDQYQAAGGQVLPPFTNLPVLWQAFTAAEPWKVDPQRLEVLIRDGILTTESARQFAEHGAPGSHLEILQRWEGWKGFHKTAVSKIIAETDARR